MWSQGIPALAPAAQVAWIDKHVEELRGRVAALEEALRAIATGERPADLETWHSGKSWRVELARKTLRETSNQERQPE